MDQNEQLLLKLEFEERFRRQIRSLFSRIRIEYLLRLSAGQAIRADQYKADFESTLRAHYRLVQKGFQTVAQHNTKQQDQDDDLTDEILAALLLWADKQAPISVVRITDTTQENMDRALEQARQAFSDSGITDYSRQELAAAAAAILRRKFVGRETAIITTETQAAAESTKLIEAYGLADLPPSAAVTGDRVITAKAFKVWVTMGDDRVRKHHRDINGQKKPVTDPFISNGEKLMYPGDSSMGASLDNIINCRCSALYTFNP